MKDRFQAEPVAGTWYVWDTVTGEVWECASFREASDLLVALIRDTPGA